MGGYTRVDKSEVELNGGKLVDARWLDINKGDMACPNYRARLVGREFNNHRDDSLYEATLPLESLRVVISHAATNLPGRSDGGRELMVNDVSRAYFYAPARRALYMKLPAEDAEALPNQVGKLNVCLYGTRDAARGWHENLSAHLISLGFVQGKGHPAAFVHRTRDILTIVHGDDYVSSSTGENLDWLEGELEKKYAIKTQRLRKRGGDEKESEVKVLNRVVRCTSLGFEVEVDPRHAELIIQQTCGNGGRSVATPGVDEREKEEEEEEEEAEALEGEAVTQYRSISARWNYLSQDRPELMYATKESCRDTASPTKSSWRRLVRIGQFLKGKPRLVWHFGWQDAVDWFDVLGDANWAGCRRTRKSTSGGVTMVGSHCTRAWSKTQAIVARSSGESELCGVVRATCEALGTQTLFRDFVREVKAKVHVDASIAKSICERKGLDNIRHLDVANLWLQEQQVRDKAPLAKIHGKVNLADLMTKHLSFKELRSI